MPQERCSNYATGGLKLSKVAMNQCGKNSLKRWSKVKTLSFLKWNTNYHIGHVVAINNLKLNLSSI